MHDIPPGSGGWSAPGYQKVNGYLPMETPLEGTGLNTGCISNMPGR